MCLVSFQNSISAIRRNPEIERLLESELTALTSVALSMSDAEVTQTLKGIDTAEIPELKRQEWEMKVESDPFAAFINERVIHDANAKIAVGNGGDPDTLYGVYMDYCKFGGSKALGLNNFSPKTQSDDKALTGQSPLPENDSANLEDSNNVGLSLHSVDPSVDLKPRQGKGCVGHVDLTETSKNSDKSDNPPPTNSLSAATEPIASDEPLKVGDKAVWVKCHGYLESWQPFEIVSIDDDLAMLDLIEDPVALSELRRNL